jgi:hypothetical protein
MARTLEAERQRATESQPAATKRISLGRHRRSCTVCSHKYREEIERVFISWTSAKAIVKEFGLKDRTALYRQAHALGLFAKHQRNTRAALERIIERVGDVEVTAAAVVAAVQAYAKVNSKGQWIERVEHLGMNDMFERMTREELGFYAKDGNYSLVRESGGRNGIPQSGEGKQ